MQNKMISPGVFTRERDQSFLQSGTADASGSIVGPTERGPAFEPVTVTSPEEYINIFGQGGYYTDTTALDYLRSADSVTVVRILGGSPSAVQNGVAGFSTNVYELNITLNDGEEVVAAIETSSGETPAIATADASNFVIELGNSSYALSLDPARSNYIANVLTRKPTPNDDLYLLSNFKEFHRELFSDSGEGSSSSVTLSEGITRDFTNTLYSEASTPWIVSQNLLEDSGTAASDETQLFKFHTLSHGSESNNQVKIAIEDIVLPEDNPDSPYGTFTVVVRDFNDSDQNPIILETFTDVNLNPDSDGFIARKIGNKNTQLSNDGSIRTSGRYERLSDYVRVEVSESLIDANERGQHTKANLIPWGFESYQIPYNVTGTIPHGLKIRQNQKVNDDTYTSLGTPDWVASEISDSSTDSDIYLGFDFSYSSNRYLLSSVPTGLTNNVDAEFDFNISDDLGDRSNTTSDYDEASNSGTMPNERKFILGFQGGHDGAPYKPIAKGDRITASNSQGFDCSTSDAPGTLAYKDAFSLLSDPERYDLDLLVTPGVINSMHPEVVQSAIRLCESRKDMFYVLDPAGPEASVRDAVNSVQTLSSSYAAAYFPWIRTVDSQTNRIEDVPPSSLIPRVYAFSDSVADPWYAAAGLTRGGIPAAVEAVQRFNKASRDELYAGRVNPIAEYSAEGVVVFGQKTLYSEESALNRINVRRMIIKVKKYINMTAKYVTFEQNTSETRGMLRDSIEPYLNIIKQRSGLYAFRLKIDAELNTPDVIDRGIIRGEIYLKPARTSEYVTIGLNIQNTGAIFDDEMTSGT